MINHLKSLGQHIFIDLYNFIDVLIYTHIALYNYVSKRVLTLEIN